MRFEAEITDLSPALGFELPFDPKVAFGRVRAPVRVSINGVTFRTTVASMGGRVFVGMNWAAREATGASAGDRVEVDLVLDDEPRTVQIPDDLAAALDPESRGFLDSLSYTHRKEYVRWIEDASVRRRGRLVSRERSRCSARAFVTRERLDLAQHQHTGAPWFRRGRFSGRAASRGLRSAS